MTESLKLATRAERKIQETIQLNIAGIISENDTFAVDRHISNIESLLQILKKNKTYM